MKRLRCTVANVTIEFRGSDGSLLTQVRDKCAAFMSDCTPDAIFEVKSLENAVHHPGAKLTATMAGPHEVRFSCGQSLRCSLDLTSRLGVLEIPRDGNSFGRAMRAILSKLLPMAGGLLVHGAAIDAQGRGYLFPGPSGAGKTTIAEISRRAGQQVLADEIAAVHKQGNGWILSSTPFFGAFREPRARSVELAAICKPIQSDHASCAPLGAAEAVTTVLRCVLNFLSDALSNANILALTSDLVERTPSAIMKFGKYDTIWEVLGDGELYTPQSEDCLAGVRGYHAGRYAR